SAKPIPPKKPLAATTRSTTPKSAESEETKQEETPSESSEGEQPSSTIVAPEIKKTPTKSTPSKTPSKTAAKSSATTRSTTPKAASLAETTNKEVTLSEISEDGELPSSTNVDPKIKKTPAKPTLKSPTKVATKPAVLNNSTTLSSAKPTETGEEWIL